MDTLTSKSSSTGSNPTPQNWYAELEQLEQEIATLQKEIKNDEQELPQLEQELQDLENEKPSPDRDAKIAALKSQIASVTAQIQTDQDQIVTDTATINTDQAEVTTMTAGLAASTQGFNQVKKVVQQSASQSEREEQLVEEREAAFKQASDGIQYTEAKVEDAIDQMNMITKDQEQIDTDNAKIEALQDEIIEDAAKAASAYAAAIVTFGASLAVAAYYTAQVVMLQNEKNDLENEVSNLKSDITTRMGILKSDLQTLMTLDENALNSTIHDLFKTVQKILAIVMSSKSDESSMQEVSTLLAEVMTFVQMIATKIQQMRSQNDQLQGVANADEQEIAANKSKIAIDEMAALQEFASFVQTAMKIVQGIADAAAVVGAIASGGTASVAMAAIMIGMSESGLFNMATTALAQKMAGGAIWAQVLADVLITVASVVVTRSVSQLMSRLTPMIAESAAEAGSQLATRLASRAVAQAVEEVEMELAAIGKSIAPATEAGAEAAANGVAGQAAQAANQARTLSQKAFDALKNVAKSIKDRVCTPNVGMSLVFLGANNGIVDSAEFFAALNQGDANKTKEQLEQQQLFQTLGIVMGVVQAIVQMIGTKITFSGQSAGGSLNGALQKLLGTRLNALINASRFALIASNLGLAGLHGGQAAIDYRKGTFQVDLATADASTNYYKNLGDMSKLFDKKEIELFASKLQQSIAETTMMVNKAGEAEMEAARMLEVSAV